LADAQKMNNVVRVTRFSPKGRLFTLGSLKKQKTYMYIPQYFATFCHEHFSYINFDKKWIGLHFWRFFSQTHLGTLNVVDTRVTRWFCKKAPIMCEAQPSFSHI
jgi:hypothetical protein